MTEATALVLGAAATLAGAGVSGAFALVQQRSNAADARRSERRRDLLETVDLAIGALAAAQFEILRADIRVQAYVAGHDVESFLETDAPINDAIRDLRTVRGRLAVRAPHERRLLDAYAAATDALLVHRSLVRSSAERRALRDDLEPSRVRVEAAVQRFHEAGAGVLTDGGAGAS